MREILEIAGIQCMLENVTDFRRSGWKKGWVAWLPKNYPPKLRVAPHRVVLLEMNIPGFEPSSAGYVAGDVAESGRQAERSC